MFWTLSSRCLIFSSSLPFAAANSCSICCKRAAASFCFSSSSSIMLFSFSLRAQDFSASFIASCMAFRLALNRADVWAISSSSVFILISSVPNKAFACAHSSSSCSLQRSKSCLAFVLKRSAFCCACSKRDFLLSSSSLEGTDSKTSASFL